MEQKLTFGRTKDKLQRTNTEKENTIAGAIKRMGAMFGDRLPSSLI